MGSKYPGSRRDTGQLQRALVDSVPVSQNSNASSRCRHTYLLDLERTRSNVGIWEACPAKANSSRKGLGSVQREDDVVPRCCREQHAVLAIAFVSRCVQGTH